jgi:hypothetical protein
VGVSGKDGDSGIAPTAGNLRRSRATNAATGMVLVKATGDVPASAAAARLALVFRAPP